MDFCPIAAHENRFDLPVQWLSWNPATTGAIDNVQTCRCVTNAVLGFVVPKQSRLVEDSVLPQERVGKPSLQLPTFRPGQRGEFEW